MDKEYLLTAAIPDLQCTLECRRLPAERSYPTSEVRGSSQEELPHLQGAVGALAQEGLEELFHTEGQDRRLRRYPSSKVRSNGCAVLERP